MFNFIVECFALLYIRTAQAISEWNFESCMFLHENESPEQEAQCKKIAQVVLQLRTWISVTERTHMHMEAWAPKPLVELAVNTLKQLKEVEAEVAVSAKLATKTILCGLIVQSEASGKTLTQKVIDQAIQFCKTSFDVDPNKDIPKMIRDKLASAPSSSSSSGAILPATPTTLVAEAAKAKPEPKAKKLRKM